MVEVSGMMKGKSVLITGGAGFIGSNLARRLLELGADVTVIDAMIPNTGANKRNLEEIENKIKFVQADIRDDIDELIKDKDYIFHLAALISHSGSMEDPKSDMDINVKGTLNLLEACRKNSKAVLVYTGTRSQYGTPQYLPVDEKHLCNPKDINGINKLTAEKYVLLYSKLYGIKSICLRLTNTYGPRHQMKYSRQGFLNWFIRLAMDNKKIQVFGNGENKRDFNYIDDVIDALILIAEKEAYGEVFNLGGENASVLDLAKAVSESIGGSYEIVPYPDEVKRVEVGDFIASYDKIKKLGWKPKTTLKEGIRRTKEFYEKNKAYYW
jgi:UDP-glucose 4-epimerase